ncbi:MAG: BNR repeat-containing protein [Prolixibacteraceae bacterium]
MKITILFFFLSFSGFTNDQPKKIGDRFHALVCEEKYFLSKSNYSITEITGQREKIIDERNHQEIVKSIIPIDKVWSGHPAGFSLLTHGSRQYIAYYNAERHIMVGQRRLTQDKFELFGIPPHERQSAEGTSTILEWDSHNYLTLVIDKEGYIHLSGNMHVNGLTYFRSTKPEDITTLVQIPGMTGKNEKKCTYPVFIINKEGELVFRYRDGQSGNGNDIYNIYSTETKHWTRLLDTPLTDGEGQMNAYASAPSQENDGWYHMYWVWRDTYDCSTNHDLSYMKSPDLKKWFNVYGEPVKLPVTFGNKTLIVDPIPPHGGIINLAARLCFDSEGNPVIAYHKYDPSGNLQFYTAHFTESKWDIKKLTDWDYRWNFSGGGVLGGADVKLGSFTNRGDDLYELGYSHVKYGKGNFLLNGEMEICGKVLKPVSVTDTIKTEGNFPMLKVMTVGDNGSSNKPEVKYFLKWETLPANRDKPRPKPWPEPSQLYLYEVEIQQ